MQCGYCGAKTKTVNSRKNNRGQQIWRRRKCTQCQSIFTTHETLVPELALRLKTNNGLEPFYRDKLLLDVHKSLSHRKTSYTDAKGLTDTIIFKILPCPTGIIAIEELKNITIEVLKRFDKAAATHYTAHHQ